MQYPDRCRLPDALPAYYDDHIREKNARVNRLLADSPARAAFVFFSDLHISDHALRSPAVIRSILEGTPVRDVICGGDIVNSYGVKETALAWCDLWHTHYDFASPYFVRGNHDIYIKESETVKEGYFAPHDEVLRRFFGKLPADAVRAPDKTYYYFDRPASRVRFIAVDTNELMTYRPVGKENYFEVRVRISQEQIDWLIELLRSTPEGYSVVMAGHRPANRNLIWGAADHPELQDDAGIFGDILEAFNKKTALSTVTADGIRAEADFAETHGYAPLYICGHGHVDHAIRAGSGCVYYEINNDGYLDNGGSLYPRRVGTVSEGALDVVILDPDTRRIECIRYGAGEDKTFDASPR